MTKLANAFIPNAQLSGLALSTAPIASNYVAKRFRERWGGLWVGGKVTASPQGVSFVPNAMNVALHEKLETINIPLPSILSVTREFGWVTGIVVVRHLQGEFRFRCFGAQEVANELASKTSAL